LYFALNTKFWDGLENNVLIVFENNKTTSAFIFF
jgi:hypothetical protein